MPAEIPSIEPQSFIAGDTVKWTKSLSDYSAADGWVLTYEFRSASAPKVTITCTTYLTTDFLATISAAVSGAMAAGDWYWFARVSLAGEVYTVGKGSFTVEANPSSGTSPQDRRSPVKRIRDALQAMVEGRATREEMSYEINVPGMTQRRLALCTLAEAISALSHYNLLYQAELNAERVAQGQPSRNKIHVRFVSP